MTRPPSNTARIRGIGARGRGGGVDRPRRRWHTHAVNESPEVVAWFGRSEHPLKDVMLAVREAILAADERMTESIKWQSPTF